MVSLLVLLRQAGYKVRMARETPSAARHAPEARKDEETCHGSAAVDGRGSF